MLTVCIHLLYLQQPSAKVMSTQQHKSPVAEDYSRHAVFSFWLLSADVRKRRKGVLHHKPVASDAPRVDLQKARMQIIMHVAAVALQLASRIVNLNTDELRHEESSRLLDRLLHLTRGTA